MRLRRLLLLLGSCALAGGGGTALAAPPVVDPVSVYRSYPDEPIAFPIGAVDPDGTDLSFASSDLPPGAALDPSSGLFQWMPTAAQVGDYEVNVEVSDEDLELTATVLLLQIAPLDSCNVPVCDPPTGCTPTLPDVPAEGEPGNACCVAEPSVRVAEPANESLGCPEGEVLYLGRNNVGFGRIQNCDKLQVEAFPQGGANLRFHVEARCVTEDVALDVEMTRVDGSGDPLINLPLLCNEAGMPECTTLVMQPDGFQRALGLNYFVFADAFSLEGQEVDFKVTMTDVNGVVLERRHRVTLTLQDLADLPNPDVGDDPSDEAGCVGCHRPLDEQNRRVGIEEAHPGVDLSCVDCHGGNGTASTRAEAHEQPDPGEPFFIKDLSSDELDAVRPEYLRFINPGDLRVAGQTCGLAGCHPEHVANVPLSTMSTYGGHYTLPRYLAGMQDRTGTVAAVDVVDPDFDPATAPPGAVESFTALRGPDPQAERGTLHTLIDDYLPKACPTCHLNAYGGNDSPGEYRSSGCTACHMVYADDGLSQSADPTGDTDLVRHPIKHELTTQIPVEQCAHCHFQGGRIGLAYRGIREGGFAPEKTPPHGVTLGRTLYGHDPDYYFSDEDARNEIDETPPDLHYEAGLACMDCHVGGDVHGDGNLYQSERYQVGIRCEDCHGTVRALAVPDPADGKFKNSKGFEMKRLSQGPGGVVLLELANSGKVKIVPQIKALLDAGTNPAMNEAMGVDESDFSHTDRLECYSCHSGWRLTCLGCHVTQNDSFDQKNLTTGETTPGLFAAVRDDYSIDFFTLGENRRGKLSPLCNSMSMLLSYVDDQGEMQFEDAIRTTSDGRRGFGWNPFHHHTVTKAAIGCERCHPTAEGGNAALLAETYGYGNGQVTVMDGEEEVDLTAYLDSEGELTSDFPHPGTGPVPTEVQERALSVVVPEPAAGLLGALALVVVAGLGRGDARRSAD